MLYGICRKNIIYTLYKRAGARNVGLKRQTGGRRSAPCCRGMVFNSIYYWNSIQKQMLCLSARGKNNPLIPTLYHSEKQKYKGRRKKSFLVCQRILRFSRRQASRFLFLPASRLLSSVRSRGCAASAHLTASFLPPFSFPFSTKKKLGGPSFFSVSDHEGVISLYCFILFIFLA